MPSNHQTFATRPAMPSSLDPRVHSLAAVAIAGLILVVLCVSLQPFVSHSTIGADENAGGDVVNQIGYSALAVVSLFGMTSLAIPRRVFAAFDAVLATAVVLLVFSALQAADRSGALKSLAFTLLVMLSAMAVVTIPRDEAELRAVFKIGITLTLALSYFGVLFLPGLAIHGAAGQEPQHAGLWRGHYTHKNVAGPVMAVFMFFGIYFYRAGDRLIGAATTTLALVFVLNTGSKTTIGFLPIVIAIVMLNALFGVRRLVAVLAIAALIVISTLTVGAVIWQPFADLAVATSSDPTYTGRTTLWAFGLHHLYDHFWIGYGYDGFWLKPPVLNTALPFDAEWDYREIVHGHNNFIDIMLATGVPTGLFVIWMLCVRPLGQYVRSARYPENRRLADLFAMIVIFGMLNSHLESFWFRRADPVWIMVLIGIFGLRLTTRLSFGKADRGRQAKAQTSSA